MMNSMTGGLNSQSGFDSNFNMLLPILMKDCDDADADCKKNQKNMMVMMMTMQSQVKITRFWLNEIYVFIKILKLTLRRQTPKWDPTFCSRCFWWKTILITKISFLWWWWAKTSPKIANFLFSSFAWLVRVIPRIILFTVQTYL